MKDDPLPAPSRQPNTPPSPYPKCDLLPRALARIFDLMVCGALVALMHRAGAAAGALYLLLADGLLRGQSLGKRLVGIKVVHVPTRRGSGARLSALRNLPMAMLGLLALGPTQHWRILVAFSLAVLGYESARIWMHPLGLRIGDEVAHTQVVDAKVVVAAPALAGAAAGGHRTPALDRMPRRVARPHLEEHRPRRSFSA